MKKSLPLALFFLLLSLLLLFVFLPACSSPPPPPPPEVTPAEPPPDYSAMRLGGRETLEIAPGVTLHADHKEQATEGIVVFTGRVYLDGSAQAKGTNWPQHAYAGRALWDPGAATLTLSEGAGAERGHAVWESTALETWIMLDGKKITTHGPMKTYMTLGTHGEKAGTSAR